MEIRLIKPPAELLSALCDGDPYSVAAANGAEVSPSEIAAVVRGEGRISVTMAFELAAALGATAEYFIDGQRDFERSQKVEVLGDRDPEALPRADRLDVSIDRVFSAAGIQTPDLDSEFSVEEAAESAKALAESQDFDARVGSALFALALKATSPELVTAGIRGLWSHDREAAAVAALARTTDSAESVQAVALKDLFAINPTLALERSYEILTQNEGSRLLQGTAEKLCAGYSKNFTDELPRLTDDRSRAEWKESFLAALQKEVDSGQADFQLRARQRVTDSELAQLVKNFDSLRTPTERNASLTLLENSLPSLSKYLLLINARSDDAHLRSAALGRLSIRFPDLAASEAARMVHDTAEEVMAVVAAVNARGQH